MGYKSSWKERAAKVINTVKLVFHVGFIPTIIYLGLAQGAEPGMPELSLRNLLWW